MGKPSSQARACRFKSTHEEPVTNQAARNLSDLRQDLDLWYRICVLLYDLNNVKAAPSASRLSSTTNELYISEPYFRDDEATKIRTATIDEINDPGPSDGTITNVGSLTVEQALHNQLANFLDKRRASGDARPCGPHDMVPIYGSVFGITKEELGDERFVGRLRRSGLGDSSVRTGSEAGASETGKDPGKKPEKKGKK